MVADRAQPGQHAGGERGAVHRVVADRQRLPQPAEQHLLVGDQAAEPHRVDPDPGDVGAAGAVERRSRSRPAPAPRPASRARGRDQLRRTPGGPGGRVGLVGVVELDDLDRLVERGRLGGEAHHQHRADGEVGGDQDADARGRRPASRAAVASRSSSKPVVPTTAWIPCSMQNSQVVHDHVGMGEVDDGRAPRRSTSSSRESPASTRATSSVSGASSTARQTSRTDLAQRAQHPDLQRLAHGLQPTGAAHCPGGH